MMTFVPVASGNSVQLLRHLWYTKRELNNYSLTLHTMDSSLINDDYTQCGTRDRPGMKDGVSGCFSPGLHEQTKFYAGGGVGTGGDETTPRLINVFVLNCFGRRT